LIPSEYDGFRTRKKCADGAPLRSGFLISGSPDLSLFRDLIYGRWDTEALPRRDKISSLLISPPQRAMMLAVGPTPRLNEERGGLPTCVVEVFPELLLVRDISFFLSSLFDISLLARPGEADYPETPRLAYPPISPGRLRPPPRSAFKTLGGGTICEPEDSLSLSAAESMRSARRAAHRLFFPEPVREFFLQRARVFFCPQDQVAQSRCSSYSEDRQSLGGRRTGIRWFLIF